MKQTDEAHSLILARLIRALDRRERRGSLGPLSSRIRQHCQHLLYVRYYGPSPWVML